MSIAGNIYDGGGSKGAKFSNIGDTFEGTITGVVEKQLVQFGTDATLETWPSGDPKITPIITVQTSSTDDADDDGKRDIYLRGGAFTAFGAALREAFDHKPTDDELVGATLKMRFDSTAPSKFGNPRKLFKCRITPNASAAGAAWDKTPDNAPPAPPDDDIPF